MLPTTVGPDIRMKSTSYGKGCLKFGSSSNPKVVHGWLKVIVISFTPLCKICGLAVSDQGGDDHVAQPVGTGPSFVNVELKLTVNVPSVIEELLEPYVSPEISIFVVDAWYAVSGWVI